MYCQNCGNKLKKGIRICPNCGFENKSKNFQTKLKNVLLISFILLTSILFGAYFLVYFGYFKVPNNMKTILYEYKILPEYKDKDLVKGSLIYRKEGAKNPEAYIEDSRDGNKYRIVKMPDGNWWMAENLRFSNNIFIDSLYDNINVRKVESIKGKVLEGNNGWCDTLNEENLNNLGTICNKYGILYPIDTLLNNKVCPEGWEVPSVNDWKKLFRKLENSEKYDSAPNQEVFVVGNVLKSETANWHLIPGTDNKISDKYGFSVIPVNGNKVLYSYNVSEKNIEPKDSFYMSIPYSKRFNTHARFWTKELYIEKEEKNIWENKRLIDETYYSAVEFSNSGMISLIEENSKSGLNVRCIKYE